MKNQPHLLGQNARFKPTSATLMRPIFSCFLLVVSIIVMAGCDADYHSSVVDVEKESLTGAWRVEDIDKGGVIDNSMVTIRFDEQNRIVGSTGCNQYTGTVVLEDKAFQVGEVVSTRRGCVPAIANQEQRFLDAINDAVRYEVASNTWLLIFDASNTQRLKAIQMKVLSEPSQQDVKLDDSSDRVSYFDCAGAGKIGIRFLGPETMELSTAEGVSLLQRSRSASGAQYTGENITFWNKGKEVIFTRNEQRYACVKSL